MVRTKIAISFLIASLIILIIYTASELSESRESPALTEPKSSETGEERESGEHNEQTESRESVEKHDERAGILPLSETVSGVLFGGGGIALSIIGFLVICRKETSRVVSILLLVNGGIILSLISVLAISGRLTSEMAEGNPQEILAIGSMLVIGAITLVILGIWKVVIDKKTQVK
ncbi:MAG: hypothetical protein ACRD38_11340 [Nitrososphaerales archaeon]